jgi:predicted permease
MNWIPNVFRRGKLRQELSEEIRLHIEERAEQLMGEGLRRTEAEQQARRSFGNRTLLEERSREVWQWAALESIWADTRFAVRQLRRSPGFTFAAVFTLALAIGANAVVFSVMNAFIIHPLNVPNAQSLYGLFRPGNDGGATYPDYVDLRDRNRSFENLIAYNLLEAGLDTGKDPAKVWGYEVSGNYFDALGIQPYLGRFFHSADEHGPNSAPFIVLTYAYWHTHFQDDRGVLGRVVELNKHPFTIIGVAPPEFHGTLLFFNPDLFAPIVNHGQFSGNEGELNQRGNRWIFMTLGHLKPGVSVAQATGDLNSIGASLEKAYPKEDGKMTFTLMRPGLYGDFLGKPVFEFMTGLMVLSGLILLGACANLGSLFAARAADRSREVALRLALGSTRKRILRGLFTEAVLISLAGGLVGIAGSVVLLHGMSAWQPFPRWPIHLEVNPDAKVYLFALLMALASGLLFGAVPVRQVLRTNPYSVVKSESISLAGRRITLRDVLVVVQIAICAVLVTSSMVAVRGLMRSTHGEFGFNAENSMLVDTELSMAGYSGDRVAPMQKRMIEALQAIPGVKYVGLGDAVALGDGATDSNVFTDNTADLKPANAAFNATVFRISPDYFLAEGSALMFGRAFTWHDNKGAPRVAVVNQEFARKIFGSAAAAMGRYFKAPDGTRIQVVGIAADGKYGSLTEDPVAVMFLPILQSPSSATFLVVRFSGDAQRLAPDIRGALRHVDAGLPVFIQPRFKEMDAVLFGPRMATISLGVLGMMGAMLSITGVFGIAAYSVSKRLRELGIRIALGAKRREVLQAALGRAVKLLGFGSAAGLLLGVLASKVLAFVVYQASPRDPLVLAAVVLAMALLGLVATWIPAQRALSVDPLVLLRDE